MPATPGNQGVSRSAKKRQKLDRKHKKEVAAKVEALAAHELVQAKKLKAIKGADTEAKKIKKK